VVFHPEMTDLPLVSIIVRTLNEERWIGSCLRNIRRQDYPNKEVVLVDNCSTDRTIQIAQQYGVKIVTIDEFRPGRALNLGIENSSGEIIVCLSGHCIPVNSTWLRSLVRDLADPKVGGIYGRQEPLSFSSDFDKRDLLTVFGLDKKIQLKDPFFHNANSAMRRELWEKFPFDDKVTNIEDRVWAAQILGAGYCIHYEPTASVYHYHGIHQDMNAERARNVVRILESTAGHTFENRDLRNQKVIALIPTRGPLRYCAGRPLLELPIKAALAARSIDEVWVAADTAEVAELARSLGAKAPFLRPPDLSEDYIDVREVYKYMLEEIESHEGAPDLVVALDETYPFRPAGLLDELVGKLAADGLDSVVAGYPEYRHIRMKKGEAFTSISEGYMPRQLKETQTYVDLNGLGCATRPMYVREGSLLGNRIGILEVSDPLCDTEIRDAAACEAISPVLQSWLAAQAANKS
jgi:rhamnosyltransferase